ncbi:MAG: DUF4202 domain-containing protein [Deltaproteobacteria bacterium]|nr:DUF4202 domain-containing protein [Deltaproteobacteria bacterium]MBW2723182.1 DUF4202 domain-containing protein [Deltaproteobacteria bacterium]
MEPERPDPERLARAIAEIDRANADDPNQIEVRGELRPKELAHADLASEWIARLIEQPSEALQLAARAHHLRRWSLPRSNYPEGRSGYLVWRQALKQQHADEAARILEACGYGKDAIRSTSEIILRKNLTGNAEAQALEDALCLVFFETQLAELAGRLAPEKMRDIGTKTLRNMSTRARDLALELPIDATYIELLRELCETL